MLINGLLRREARVQEFHPGMPPPGFERRTVRARSLRSSSPPRRVAGFPPPRSPTGTRAPCGPASRPLPRSFPPALSSAATALAPSLSRSSSILRSRIASAFCLEPAAGRLSRSTESDSSSPANHSRRPEPIQHSRSGRRLRHDSWELIPDRGPSRSSSPLHRTNRYLSLP
jgi:hypothetical protein